MFKDKRGFKRKPFGSRPREGGSRPTGGFNRGPRREGGYGPRSGPDARSEGSYSPRPAAASGERREYSPRPAYGERREGSSYRPAASSERREGGYSPRPAASGEHREYRPAAASGERREYSPRPAYGERREGGYSERREYRPRPAYGERREGGYSPRPSYGGRREGGSSGRGESYRPRRDFEDRGGFNRSRSFQRGSAPREEREGGFERDRFMRKAREGVGEAYRKPDAALVQAARAIDDLDQAKSLLYQRLCEWVQLNFPEMDLKNEETVCALYAEYGDRSKFEKKKLDELFGIDRAEKVAEQAKKSFGAEFDKEDRTAVRALASRVLELFKARVELTAYAETKARKEMPNVSELVEPLLAARLLSLAGNLKNLAEMPASTIQVIGAEKALFKHLKNPNIAPPKHGVIFQSPLVNAAPLEHRGKIARALAAKLSIAARADYYTKNPVAKKLKADLEKRLKAIAGEKAAE